jgi:ATP-dependent Clp protease adaptor protein ClpS
LNDDFTPMEFVVEVLQRFFDYDSNGADRLMRQSIGTLPVRAEPIRPMSPDSRPPRCGHTLAFMIIRCAASASREFGRFRVSMSLLGPWLTPPGRPGAGPLTEVHRPCAKQAADVVGAPAYDP